jgi:tetratricopeptide (TPR) repeat protein
MAEPPEKEAEILKSVRGLQKFKAYLESGTTRQLFTNPDDLAKHVTATLATFAPKPGHAAAVARVWKPLYCHALQPAQHFRGRDAKLQQLRNWLESPVNPDRVVSLVAAGGTGKTALANQALHEAKLSDRGGVFVWSFYEDPQTDKFLRAAYEYFTGEKDAPAGGMLERLQLALTGDLPHILVLDGLERVQSEGTPRKRGELEDLQLRRLLRTLAGGMGSARALVTSRFPLVDLELWTGAGHRPIALDDLERPVALEVMRAWGVKGDEDRLARLIDPLNIGGVYHALSVAVLGSYFGNFPEAREFSIGIAGENDPKSPRLARILEQYAKALSAVERDLMARLSLFPRGVKVELLGWIVQAGGEVAGALIGLQDRQLVSCLERLKALGLVFRYLTDGQAVYSAHPFLREFFRERLGTNPEAVHESVRAKLAPSLEAKPDTKPRDTKILDQYELLIEETLLAGRVQEAFDLYWYGLGSYDNLGHRLGENVRGLRILESFVPLDDFSRITAELSRSDQAVLVNAIGLFAENLGDIDRARAAFAHAQWLDPKSISERNAADVELLAGHFRQALDYSENAVSRIEENEEGWMAAGCFAYRATAHFGLGNVEAATADFEAATERVGRTLYSIDGISQAESKFLSGDQAGARSQTEANLEIASRNDANNDLCRCNALIARLLLPDEPASSGQHLLDARAFASRSGNIELQLRCFQAACELQRALGDLQQSVIEGEAGVLLADTCGFGTWSIEIRIALAETYLAAGDAHKALQHARRALDLSEAPDCEYAWGKADGLHFCGVAHLRLGERELARQRLTAALEIRKRLRHGRIDETRRALAQLPDHGAAAI